MVQNLPALREIEIQSLGQEDPLEKGMATHSSILAWRIPWTEEPGGLQLMGLQRVRHDCATKQQTSACTCACESLSHVRLFATPWSVSHQAPLSMGFSRQGYWSGLPFPSLGNLPNPGNFPNPGTEPSSLALEADCLPAEPPGKPLGATVLASNPHLLHLLRSEPQVSHLHKGDPSTHLIVVS